MTDEKEKYIIYGGQTGWIGTQLVQICKDKNLDFAIGASRIEDRNLLAQELDNVKPTHVLMAAGLTGRPTVDWCEDHKQDVIRVNVVGVLSLVDLCFARGIHVTNFATGCIFKYDENHPIGGCGFAESDMPNFTGSFYSHTKGVVENLLQHYNNCLTLRIRMPISADLLHRNFITKIVNYQKVVDIPNSMTTLDDLLPVAIEAAQRKLTGILNLCNPGSISHNEILQLFKKHIDHRFTWTNFTEAECNAILKAQRSNNTLDHTKLLTLFPNVPEIHIACEQAFLKMRDTIDKEGVESLKANGWKFPTHHTVEGCSNIEFQQSFF